MNIKTREGTSNKTKRHGWLWVIVILLVIAIAGFAIGLLHKSVTSKKTV